MAAYKSIILSGKPGSGKTTLARRITEGEELGLRFTLLSAGEEFRKEAALRHLDIDTFYEKNVTEEMDRAVDKRVKERVEAGGVVADCRVPLADRSVALRTFVHAPVAIRAERLVRGGRADYAGLPVEEVVRKLRRREETERERYLEYYGIDIANPEIWKLHLDSSNMSVDDEVREVKREFLGEPAAAPA